MSKYDVRKLRPEEKQRLLTVLERAILTLKDAGALREFLRYFLTPSEIAMLGRRLMVARLLLEGMTYLEVRQKIGVGLTTVQFVDRWLRVTLREQYRYGDLSKRRKRGRRLLLQAQRRAMAREARSRRPAGIFWLNRALGAELLPR